MEIRPTGGLTTPHTTIHTPPTPTTPPYRCSTRTPRHLRAPGAASRRPHRLSRLVLETKFNVRVGSRPGRPTSGCPGAGGHRVFAGSAHRLAAEGRQEEERVTSSGAVTSLATVTVGGSGQVRPRQDTRPANRPPARDHRQAYSSRESPSSCCLASESGEGGAERALTEERREGGEGRGGGVEVGRI